MSEAMNKLGGPVTEHMGSTPASPAAETAGTVSKPMDGGEPAAPDAVQVEAAPDAAALGSEVEPDELARWNEQVKRRMRQQTRRSFVVGGVAALAGLAGWRWLRSRREDDGIPWPFRRALEINEQLGRDYFRPDRLAPSFSREAVVEDRVNGDLGMDIPIDISAWKLLVEGLAASEEPLRLTLDAIQKLPRVEMTTELKCIEGWAVAVRWAGARFSDFIAAYPPATISGERLDLKNNPDDLPPYVSLETPDRGYYVGLDIESMLHPQTLLCYEMNGAPLTQEHGAPLRLAIPVKYGVKNIKRIGTMRYARQRPADYWAERGYDWYIGL